MPIELNNHYGQIDVSNDVIARIAGGAAIDCQGIVGMASRRQLKDGITELLKKENFSRGVVVHLDEKENLVIDMYIIVSYGTKISELAFHVQNKVREMLDQMLSVHASAVNIYVQGVRMVEAEEDEDGLILEEE